MMENVGYNMRTPNLKFILETIVQDQPVPTTPQEKKQFMQEIKNFSNMANSVYGTGDIQEIVERVKRIIDGADRIMTESDDWFENVANKKSNKRMIEDYKDFTAAAKSLQEAQHQMSIAYENIGQHLNRYFDVG
jgi:hypothetical protein